MGRVAQLAAGGAPPLFSPAADQRAIAFRGGAPVSLGEFRAHVSAIARALPRGAAMINLCEDRYRFLGAYAAAASLGHTVLLPPSRAHQVVAEIEQAHAHCYRFDDAHVEAALSMADGSASMNEHVAAHHIVMIGFTSGSTGRPKSFPKAWASVSASTALNAKAIRQALAIEAQAPAWILATVPPQHMYGMELSILLPLAGGLAVHSSRPLFPADVARSLEELPGPRVLVSTPVHLRAMVESAQPFPQTDLVVSATAPLDPPLAAAVERKLGGQLLELFGSTETCVFAYRRTAVEDVWTLYDGVELTPADQGTWVAAPWFAEPVQLQDIVDLRNARQFSVRGRNSDMIEVAGKRASLFDLTRRVLAIQGVRDAVVFQPEPESVATIRRVMALVVAPGMTAREILDRLAPGVDPAFLPRPLVLVDELPRNELGKLPRQQLLAAVRGKAVSG